MNAFLLHRSQKSKFILSFELLNYLVTGMSVKNCETIIDSSTISLHAMQGGKRKHRGL